MRRPIRAGILFFLLGTCASAFAKTDITVARFTDKAPAGHCPKATQQAKLNFKMDPREELIQGLLRLNRFQIQEREIRKVYPQHSIMGAVKTFEVCSLPKRGQTAQVALELKLVDVRGNVSYVFTTRAEASSATLGRAPALAMSIAIKEALKYMENTLPRRQAVRVPAALNNQIVAGTKSENELTAQLVRRDHHPLTNCPGFRR